jgi:hypothetical protein
MDGGHIDAKERSMHSHTEDRADPTRRALLAAVATAPAWAAVRLASANAPSAGSSDLPAELAQAVRDYDRATIGNDVATLGRLASGVLTADTCAAVTDRPLARRRSCDALRPARA